MAMLARSGAATPVLRSVRASGPQCVRPVAAAMASMPRAAGLQRASGSAASSVTGLTSRRMMAAPVALPPLVARPGNTPMRGDVQCAGLGLGSIGALCGKILKLIGIKGGAGAVKAAAASAAGSAATAGKAAMIAAVSLGLLKYLWWAIAAAGVIGLAVGSVLGYLGIPQVAVDKVNSLLGKQPLKLYTNPASRGTIVGW